MTSGTLTPRTPVRPAGRRPDRGNHVRQQASHAHLLRPVTSAAPLGTRTVLMDAIIVPAGRRAHHLRWAILLAAQCRTTLVVLASHDCDLDEATRIVAETPRCHALVIGVPQASPQHLEVLGQSHPLLTSDPDFHRLSAGRESNLSRKRNLGLLLARLRGWRKVIFLDDDLTQVTAEQVARVAHQLESNPFAGLRTTRFPDNSVVCHANRLAGYRQGIFVSGAALGVNTADLPLEIFPDIYNEDWLAFAGQADTGGVALMGDVGQIDFNPFQDPQRARHEEFGDVIAEGSYALYGRGDGLARATISHWNDFIDARQSMIEGLAAELSRRETNESVQACAALGAALDQLGNVTAEHCRDFVGAWQEDRKMFATLSAGLPTGVPLAESFAALGLSDWRQARHGIPEMLRL